ncbi:nitroreductase family protein [Sciscionella marina]|uniref:nitroreductase family protein n=1 Tax=Sciscionella marina TaxID=508770 RepID=UPI00037DD278|nr:nitroreductase family protein [Sciscionella marina]
MKTLSDAETGLLARALEHAPSFCPTRPWRLEVQANTVRLDENRAAEPDQERALSCGAALTALELSLRALGRQPWSRLFPRGRQAELLASIEAGMGGEPETAELTAYSALFRRRSYRAPFAPRPLSEVLCESLLANAIPVPVRRLGDRTDTYSFAGLLCAAARTRHADQAFHQELLAWSTLFPVSSARESGASLSGLMRTKTYLPQPELLASRIAAESVVLLYTETDSRPARVQAGAALHRLWLAAIAEGLAGSVLVRPLRSAHLSAGVARAFGIEGHPQALFRFGYPAA